MTIDIEWLKEKKCQEVSCWNYVMSGYTVCVGHLHEFPHRMSEEHIEALKKEGYGG